MQTHKLSVSKNGALQRGITLIELMIVVTVLGALTVMSIPAYRGYAERAHRTEALTALAKMDARQQSYLNLNNTFADDAEALGFTGSCTENCVYLISFDGTPDSQSYTARLTPNPDGGTNGVNQMSDEQCSWFTIDALGRREAENDSCLGGR
jgi:type IV pilus assembly protein PilE